MAELVVRVTRTNSKVTTYDWPARKLPLREVSTDYAPPAGFNASKASLEDLSTHRLATGLQSAKNKVAAFECDHEGIMVVRTDDKVQWPSIDKLVEDLLRDLEVPGINKVRLMDYELLNW